MLVEIDREKGFTMRKVLVSSLLLVLLAAPAVPAAAPELKTEEQKTLYALGLAIAQNLGSFALTPAELEVVKAGMTDGVAGKEKDRKVDFQVYGPKIQDLQRGRMAAASAVERKSGQAFADKAAGEKGAAKTASGAIVTAIKPGSGAHPKPDDKVKVHYHGMLTDGSVFDSSVQRGEPVTFPLNGVIKCWSEGVQQIKVGGKSRLVCPADTAYGDRGAPPKIKPGATLVFEVELLEIVK
jgi:FKBP-type peptidyl-prolyl cis-trans isomerase FkpA/FKBP-type peptidyl-prolyl cis-trans isomerase FklB